MKLKVILTLFLLFTTHSCAIYERLLLLEMNPCFHLENREFEIECYKWRTRYPKEYNRFYNAAKEHLPDTIWQKLPDEVVILRKK